MMLIELKRHNIRLLGHLQIKTRQDRSQQKQKRGVCQQTPLEIEFV